jgi:hypothetical protein
LVVGQPNRQNPTWWIAASRDLPYPEQPS